MNIRGGFKNVFSYGAGMENWVRGWFEKELGYKMEYTFVYDFAVADWFGRQDVIDTYNRVKESWLDNYKAFTEVAMSLSMLSNAHYQLRKQGYDGREAFVELYEDLFYKAKEDFYDKYVDNGDAQEWFFKMTD